VPTPIDDWKIEFKQFELWVRLSAAMSIAGYFEVYLRSMIRAALESDPGVLIASPKSVDGAALLKRDPSYSYLGETEPCLKGDWTKRLSAYREFFGKVPPELEGARSELDSLRNLRNGVGHTFGREPDDYTTRYLVGLRPFTPLSAIRLQKWQGLVETAAMAVDEHLLADHIGAYEAVAFYHEGRPEFARSGGGIARAFKKSLSRTFTDSPSYEYCQELSEYYEKLN